jgi:hypothetical protein
MEKGDGKKETAVLGYFVGLGKNEYTWFLMELNFLKKNRKVRTRRMVF